MNDSVMTPELVRLFASSTVEPTKIPTNEKVLRYAQSDAFKAVVEMFKAKPATKS